MVIRLVSFVVPDEVKSSPGVKLRWWQVQPAGRMVQDWAIDSVITDAALSATPAKNWPIVRSKPQLPMDQSYGNLNLSIFISIQFDHWTCSIIEWSLRIFPLTRVILRTSKNLAVLNKNNKIMFFLQ